MAPAPTLGYPKILCQLFLMLHQFSSEHQSGEIWLAPMDVIIQREPLLADSPAGPFVRQ